MRSFVLREVSCGLRKLLSPKDKWCLLGLFFLLCIGAGMEIAGIGLLLPLVAVLTKPELFEQNFLLRLFRELFSWADEKQFLVICCACVVGMYVVKNVWIFFIMRYYTAFSYKKLGEISTRLYTHLLSSEYRTFSDYGKVDLQSRIAKIDQMGSMVLLPCMLLMVDLMTIVFISLMLLFTIPGVICSCILIFGAGSLLIYFPLRHISWRTGEGLNSVVTRLNKISFYSFEDIKSVKVLGLEKFFAQDFKAVREERCSYETTLYILGQIPRLVLETLAVIASVLVFAVMLWCGEPIGTVVLSFSLLVAAMSRLLPAASRINYSLNNIRTGVPLFREIIEAFGWEQEDLGDPESSISFKEELRVENLSFTYPGSDRKIIDNLSFKLKYNGSLAVIGPTGGGKSTLIDLLLGLRIPQTGTITADGKNIFGSLASWRKIIGFVPQVIALADDSIAANVAMGCTAEEIDRSRVRAVLRTAQLDSFVDSLPQGMDTLIGDNGIRLSGGQRQRLGIARALYRDPEIIIFDEATSALDVETEQALMDSLDNLYGQKTLIMVAHRLSTVEKCDQRIEIKPPEEAR